MPKEYSDWIASMAGSIEDGSIIDRHKPEQTNKSLTPLQIRCAIADLLVPNPCDDDLVADWVSVFSIALDCAAIGHRSVTEESLVGLIGRDSVLAYSQADSPSGAVTWLSSLRSLITRDML